MLANVLNKKKKQKKEKNWFTLCPFHFKKPFSKNKNVKNVSKRS